MSGIPVTDRMDEDDRRRLRQMLDRGTPTHVIAAHMGVSARTIQRHKAAYK